MPCVCLFHHGGILNLVGMEGVEPPRLSAVDFESTTSAIPSHTHVFLGYSIQSIIVSSVVNPEFFQSLITISFTLSIHIPQTLEISTEM